MSNTYDCTMQHKTFRSVENFQVYVRKGESVRDACFRKLAKRRKADLTEMVKHYEVVNTKNLGQVPAPGSLEEDAALACDGHFKETGKALACREGAAIMRGKMVESLTSAKSAALPPVEMPKGAPPKVRIVREKQVK